MARKPTTAEQHRDAIRREYSQYVATEVIEHNGARAYNVGDPVPASNVVKYRYLDLGLVAPVRAR